MRLYTTRHIESIFNKMQKSCVYCLLIRWKFPKQLVFVINSIVGCVTVLQKLINGSFTHVSIEILLQTMENTENKYLKAFPGININTLEICMSYRLQVLLI